MTTPLIYGHRPEPTCRVRSLVNGAELIVRVSHAATMIVSGEADPVGTPTPELTAAIDAYKRVSCVARRARP